MSHKKIINKERWVESQNSAYEFLYSTPQSVREWFTKMTLYTVLVFVLGLVVRQLNTFVGEMILILPICTTVFVCHEGLHILRAKSLGYDIKWYPINLLKIPFTQRTMLMQGFDVIFPNKEAMVKHRWTIGLAPYSLVFPLSIILIISPLLFLRISGVILVATHLFALPYEARVA